MACIGDDMCTEHLAEISSILCRLGLLRLAKHKLCGWAIAKETDDGLHLDLIVMSRRSTKYEQLSVFVPN